MNQLAITQQQALQKLAEDQSPEAKAILNYIQAIKKKNIAVLGEDEAFILEDSQGQIRAFKKSLFLSVENGGLVKPGFGNEMPHIVSAQGYEMWQDATGASVIFPKEVLVGNDWKPNPYAERDPENRRILAVHARAIAFKYSSMGIPQVSDWTTIFDTPSYRMIDLLAKAKKHPQCFKVLPKNIKPLVEEKNADRETWASYPFDESMDLWINTSHNEVITWLSQILNREKKAMDFAQTFAKRNALKHLSGLQKAPGPQWRISILAWRPTGNNIIQWSSSKYAELQDRAAGITTGESKGFENAEIQQGSERTSEDEETTALEVEVDPEDSQETEKPEQEKESPKEDPEISSGWQSKDGKQLNYLYENFRFEFDEACKQLEIDVQNISDEQAAAICQKVDELVNEQN